MPKPPRVESQWKAERERLASELHRLEEALSDAREDSVGEDEGSLVARLRDATRKRVRIEEEFERSSDRWRDERRNLNAEIDRLDRALQKAQSDARRNRSSETASDTKLQSELNDALRRRSEVEEALEEERSRWASERHALETKVSDLESGLVDALERANNLAHGDKARDATLQTQLEADRRTIETQVRAEFEASLEKTQGTLKALEEERGQLHLEIHRLKSQPAAAEPAEAVEGAPESPRLSLKDRLRGRRKTSSDDDVQASLDAAQSEAAALRDELDRQRALTEEARTRHEAAEARIAEMESQPAAAPEPAASKLEGELRARASAWEKERDTLDARILELEASLEEARAPAAPPDTSDLEGRLAASDAALAELRSKFDTGTAAWEKERAGLNDRIQSLEASLETSRSESTSSSEAAEEISAKLSTVEEALRNAEKKLRADSEGWASEREELVRKVGEMEFALNEAQSSHSDLNSRYEQLLSEFEEARRVGNEARSQMDADSLQWVDEREALRGEIETLKSSLKETRQADASTDEARQKLTSDLEAAEAKLVRASEEWSEERTRFEGRVHDLERDLEKAGRNSETEVQRLQEALRDANQAREQTAEELKATLGRMEAASAQWSEERTQLEAAAAERDRLAMTETSLSMRVQELEASLADMTDASGSDSGAEEQRAALGARLREQTESWEAERAGLASTISDLETEVRALRKAQAKGKSKADETGESSASRGIASFGKVLSSLSGGAVASDGGTSVADLEARRQALEVRLSESEESRSDLAAKLNSATEEWEDERRKLASQLDEMTEALETAGDREHEELGAQHSELLVKLQEAETRFTELEEASMSAAKAWDDERGQLEQEISQWEQQVAEEAERVAAETRKALAEEYEKQLRELKSQKEDLESQLMSPAPAGTGSSADPAVVAAEMARVDGEIDEINRLIDDPNAALSNVMRKNAERSELKAYRRGLSYLAERVAQDAQDSVPAEGPPE